MNTQILLALSAERLKAEVPAVATLVLRGQFDDAVRMGNKLFERRVDGGPGGRTDTALGQLLGRALLALGREADAEETFHSLLKVYEGISRQAVRRHATLDQGWVFLHMNRLGRAIECFGELCGEQNDQPEMKVEALAGMAVALMGLGESAQLLRVLDQLREMECACDALKVLIDCLDVDLKVQLQGRRQQELADHALASGYRDGMRAGTQQSDLFARLTQLEARFGEQELVAERLRYLQLLLQEDTGNSVVGRFTACLNWLQSRHLLGLENSVRIEVALSLLARGASVAARDVLGILTFNEQQMRQSRYSLDLHYCMSKVYLTQGQLSDSLRLYKQHAEQAIYALKRDLQQVSNTRHGDAVRLSEATDTVKLRLPLRYRGAYQYIVEHLNDSDLSIRQIASHVGVTERSLQMAFRTHLGLTPGEFIRRERMRHIRDDLKAGAGQAGRISVMSIANRWGISNRSTLVQGYRQEFRESPSDTLYGGEPA